MSCEITQRNEFLITLSQKKMHHQLQPQLHIHEAGRKGDVTGTEKWASFYRLVIDRMLYIGNISAPFQLLPAFTSAIKLSKVQDHHLRALNTIVTHLKSSRNPDFPLWISSAFSSRPGHHIQRFDSQYREHQRPWGSYHILTFRQYRPLTLMVCKSATSFRT